MKKIFLTAALAVAVASPAFAASSHHARNSAAEQAYASAQAYGPELQGQGLYAVDRDTVVSSGEVLGRDPDAFIRQQMLRVGNTNDLGGF
jgi:opacity protein-like surface antigen